MSESVTHFEVFCTQCKVKKCWYKFVDRDGNVLLGDEELYQKVQKGARLYFSVAEHTPHYITWKKVRRRPLVVYKISVVQIEERVL